MGNEADLQANLCNESQRIINILITNGAYRSEL